MDQEWLGSVFIDGSLTPFYDTLRNIILDVLCNKHKMVEGVWATTTIGGRVNRRDKKAAAQVNAKSITDSQLDGAHVGRAHFHLQMCYVGLIHW